MVFVADRIKTMQEQEESSYKTKDYVSLLVTLGREKANTDCPLPSSESLKKWREVICEWAYNVVDLTDRPREMVAVSLNYLDRTVYEYLSQNPTITKSDYQLFSLTCLYLASKVCAPGSLTVEEAIALGRHCFTQEQIEQTERYVLKTLNWQLQPPTAHVFLKYSMLLLGLSLKHSKYVHVFERANFLLEISVMDYSFVDQKPSLVALAALLNALEREQVRLTPYQCRLLTTLVQEKDSMEVLQDCQALLHSACENVEVDEDEEEGDELASINARIMEQGYSRATSPVSILDDTMF